MTQPIILNHSLSQFMQLDQITPTIDGEAIYTWPLLLEWWRLYLQLNRLQDSSGWIYPDPSMQQLFYRDILLRRNVSRSRYRWDDLVQFLQDHLDYTLTVPLTPDLNENFQEQEMALTEARLSQLSMYT